jgi:V/A-type H+-transporting ATPase subunit B
MPAGDITHPVPDLTGYITEGQLVLSHELHVRGIYPPFDALASLSRLMRLGVGPGRTREDHLEIAAQLYAALAEARRTADLAEVVGEDALSEGERRYLAFAEEFRSRFLAQELDESRSLEETLARAWEAASVLPRRVLSMVSEGILERYYRGGGGGTARPTG